MKLSARQVRFVLPVLPTFNRRPVRFVGRDNSIQLLETAIVLEGRLQRMSFPLVDWLFRPALSEWTTITIPYSRILDFRYARMVVVRSILTALVWLPFLLLLLFALPVLPSKQRWAGDLEATTIYGGMFALLGLVLTLYINLKALAPRYVLLFRLADGKRMQASFRIPVRKKAQAFADLLENNREAAEALAPHDEVVGQPAFVTPLVLLTIYLFAHYLFHPWWQVLLGLEPPGGPASLAMSPEDLGPANFFGPPNVYWFVWILIGFLYQQGPVVLLGFLTLRWNAVVRLLAILLLGLHAIVPILGVGFWAVAFGGTQPRMANAPVLNLTVASISSLLLHLLLVLILLVQPVPPGPKEEGQS